MILGFLAIIFSGLNLSKMGTEKYKIYMFLSLSFTALSLCFFHSEIIFKLDDYSYLEDVVSYMGSPISFLALCSVAINSVPLVVDFVKGREKNV